jgi:hypothetical protein
MIGDRFLTSDRNAMRYIRIWLACALTVTVAGCDALAPLFSINVELTTASHTIGEWNSSWFSDDRFVCNPSIHVRAWGGESERTSDAEWVGGDLKIMDSESGEVLETRSVSRDEMNQRFGRRIYPDLEASRSFPVDGPVAPFRWQLTAGFYDPEARHTGRTEVSSECRAAVD